MNKQEFIATLRAKLRGLPEQEVEERLAFYMEMIEDRMEEGIAEEDAVSAVGSVEEIASQIIADIPLAKIAKERIKPKRQLKVWEIVLLALGSPIWFSLGVAAIAVIFSLYVSLWSVIISLWVVFASLVGSSFGVVVGGLTLACYGNILAGVALIGAGLVCAGLSILAFYGCKAATIGLLVLTKKIAIWIKNCFIRKEDAE